MCLAAMLGPSLSPPEFDWVLHTTSEQAGQGLSGAWLMRLGFVGYGLGTIVAATQGMGTRPHVRVPLIIFGAGLIAAAIWSNASILPDVSSDLREDEFHSYASGLVGFAFALVCAARLFIYDGWRTDVLAWLGLVASVAIPLAMFNGFPDYRGALQRSMFAVSMLVIWMEFRPRP